MDTKNHFKNWQWYKVNSHEIETLNQSLKTRSHYDAAWTHRFLANKTNFLEADVYDTKYKVMKGSLVYQQSLKDEIDYKIFHFYLAQDLLITIDFDLSFLESTNINNLQKHLENTPNAMSGFMVLLAHLLNEYLCGIDNFEIKLRELIWKIQQINEINTLEDIFKCRHEIMIWKGLLISVNDLCIGIEETFLDEISKENEFKRTCKRLERSLFLTKEYQKELETMIDMENVISSHRGNEIMKTLTVMTILFTPIMAWGALWGMNFRYIPEFKWRYGYILSIVIITLTTFALYWYLKAKGWTGDILKGKKKGSYFK